MPLFFVGYQYNQSFSNTSVDATLLTVTEPQFGFAGKPTFILPHYNFWEWQESDGKQTVDWQSGGTYFQESNLPQV